MAAFYPGLFLYSGYRRYIKGKSAASVSGLWGSVPRAATDAARKSSGPIIWLQAVSVGETIAARPIARALKARCPGCTILVSNTTDTGHEVALPMTKNGEAEGLFFFPLDLPPALRRVLGQVRPDAILFVETELWPNLLHIAHQREILTFQVNGRVSDNLAQKARLMGPVWSRVFANNMDGFLMRGSLDAERLAALGVSPSKILVTGDVKLEAPEVEASALRAVWRERLGLGDELLIVAGSTHPGEESMLVAAWSQLLESHPGLRLAIAPRHIDRIAEIKAELAAAGHPVTLRSEMVPLGPGHIFLLDSVGELADLYAAADVAFVGGSLIQRGGHNVLEPVLRGVPVLFGPHTMNFRSSVALVLHHGLGQEVPDAGHLAASLGAWLADPGRRAGVGARAGQALEEHRGAAGRIADRVLAALTARENARGNPSSPEGPRL